MIDGIINVRFKESATEEAIQAAVSQFYKMNENLIDRMDYKECNEECQAFRWGECEGNGKRTGRHVNEVMPVAKVKNLMIWTNGMVMAFDDKGEQISECQGFIFEMGESLKTACDKDTKVSFCCPGAGEFKCDFVWWFIDHRGTPCNLAGRHVNEVRAGAAGAGNEKAANQETRQQIAVQVQEEYEHDVKVRCPECDESFPEADVKITNIEEDFRGLDIVDFECPECKTSQRSHRFTIGAAITKTAFRPCTSCGVAVAQADWYKYASVILCQKCGMGVKFDDYDNPEKQLRKAATSRGQP